MPHPTTCLTFTVRVGLYCIDSAAQVCTGLSSLPVKQQCCALLMGLSSAEPGVAGDGGPALVERRRRAADADRDGHAAAVHDGPGRAGRVPTLAHARPPGPPRRRAVRRRVRLRRHRRMGALARAARAAPAGALSARAAWGLARCLGGARSAGLHAPGADALTHSRSPKLCGRRAARHGLARYGLAQCARVATHQHALNVAACCILYCLSSARCARAAHVFVFRCVVDVYSQLFCHAGV